MSRDLKVSDHALVAFMTRTGLLDVESLRAALAASLERATSAAAQIGATNYVILADGLVYHVREGVLITCLPDDERRLDVAALRNRQQNAG